MKTKDIRAGERYLFSRSAEAIGDSVTVIGTFERGTDIETVRALLGLDRENFIEVEDKNATVAIVWDRFGRRFVYLVSARFIKKGWW
jgi:hypothetical protein